MNNIRDILLGESGATSVEYCFIAGLIIAVCIVGIATFGGSLADLFQVVNAAGV